MNVRRRYHDVRAGMVTISPVVAISNFLLIAYNFSVIKDMIPFELFTVLFVVGSIVTFMIIGGLFRKNQYKIDNAIQFENNPELVRILRILLKDCSVTDEVKDGIRHLDDLLRKQK